jgi:hypothetical protein
MSEDHFQHSIGVLEALWDGPLSDIRMGIFTFAHEREIRITLTNIQGGDSEFLPRRFVSLLWSMSTFMEWQIRRVGERSGLDQEYRNLSIWVFERIGEILGNP